MSCILIASNTELYSSKRIIDVFEREKKELLVYSPLCDLTSIDLSSTFEKPLVILPRFSDYYHFEGLRLLKEFETRGGKSLNPSWEYSLLSDKYLLSRELEKNKIPNIKSFSASDLINCLKLPLEGIFVRKPRRGSKGKDVTLVDSTQINLEMNDKESFISRNVDFVFQTYHEEYKGLDVRVLVLGNRILGSILRKASNDDEFRSNVSLGGISSPYSLSKSEFNLVESFIKISSGGFYGLDILLTNEGPKILELNLCPGFEAFEKINGLVIAEQLLIQLEML